jgi:hypothetical protein
MNCLYLLAASMLTLVAAPAPAQFVQGNQAVQKMPDGITKVETPPLPSGGPIRNSKPCFAETGCHAGAWLMVETADGLVECTEAFARRGTCRPSTYGSVKLYRLWVIKAGGAWLQCQKPDRSSKCVDMFSRPPANLPYPALQ